ncbi:MAG: hypothetical protein LBS83_01140 [Holosporales bacterium]|jgi:hypothetical protein|nr:hypothetical protein [Holosporales bacterium]
MLSLKKLLVIGGICLLGISAANCTVNTSWLDKGPWGVITARNAVKYGSSAVVAGLSVLAYSKCPDLSVKEVPMKPVVGVIGGVAAYSVYDYITKKGFDINFKEIGKNCLDVIINPLVLGAAAFAGAKLVCGKSILSKCAAAAIAGILPLFSKFKK